MTQQQPPSDDRERADAPPAPRPSARLGMYSRAFQRAEAETVDASFAAPVATVAPAPEPEATAAQQVPQRDAGIASPGSSDVGAAPRVRAWRRFAPKAKVRIRWPSEATNWPRTAIASRPLHPRTMAAMAAGLVLVAVLTAIALPSSDDRIPQPIPVPAAAAVEPAPVHAAEEPPATARDPAPATDAVTAGGDSATRLARGTTPAATARREKERAAPAARPTDGSLVIVSQPAGARVTVNGIGWGETPLTIGYLPFGAKRVRLIKDGYVSVERNIEIGPERPSATLRVTLRQRQ